MAGASERGMPGLGQSVLLHGVDDSAPALDDLIRTILAARVKPYSLAFRRRPARPAA